MTRKSGWSSNICVWLVFPSNSWASCTDWSSSKQLGEGCCCCYHCCCSACSALCFRYVIGW